MNIILNKPEIQRRGHKMGEEPGYVSFQNVKCMMFNKIQIIICSTFYIYSAGCQYSGE